MQMPAMLLLWAALSAGTQTASSTQSATAADLVLHADVIHFIEVSGAKNDVAGSMAQSLADGKKQFAEQCPTCSAAYLDEWSKRMSERMTVDRVMEVFIDAYEKYLNDANIKELTTLQQAALEGRSVTPSADLQAKLTTVMPALQAEVTSKCAAIGAKLGEQIAAELEKDYPETKSTGPVAAKPAAKPGKN